MEGPGPSCHPKACPRSERQGDGLSHEHAETRLQVGANAKDNQAAFESRRVSRPFPDWALCTAFAADLITGALVLGA